MHTLGLLALAQDTPSDDLGGVTLVILVGLVSLAASVWRVFARAGEPGWAALVPIYNAVVLARVAGKSGWWSLLLLLPYVNLIALLPVSLGVARRFGRGGAFGVGLWLLPFVFYPVLAFEQREAVHRQQV